MSMSWTDFKKYYGFQSPFVFKVAIPFLLSIFILALVLLVSAVMLFNGSLSVGTFRFHFFSYIIVLLLIAAVCSRMPPVSYALFFWCIVELGLALSSNVLAKYGIGAPLLPQNFFAEKGGGGFQYHPLFQWAPSPNWKEKRYFDVRNKDVFDANWPIDWTKLQGRQFTFSHNSLGRRGVNLTEKDLEKDMIFVYGGSTTYDVYVTQGSTWVEQLQSRLNGKYTLLNFGVPAHSTTENLIQTAFYQGIAGKRPVCAIYYVGWNDIHNAHIENLDAAYADYHLPHEATFVRRPSFYFASYSPLALLVSRAASRRFDTLPQDPSESIQRKTVSGSDERLEAIFVDHINTIKAINDARGIKTIFIGQILNRDYLRLRPHDANYWVWLVRNEDVWPLQERFNSVMRSTSVANGAKYIDAGIENFRFSDFVDQGHFTAAGSKKFATLISREVGSYCQ